METMVYFLSFSVALADVFLPESLYNRTICYVSSEPIIYPNCSKFMSDADVIAISSIKTISKRTNSSCSGQKPCCGHVDAGDCIITYPNKKYPGRYFDLQKKCMGHKIFCSDHIEWIPSSLDCSTSSVTNPKIDIAEIQYYCIKGKNIASLRQGRHTTSNFASVYLQSFDYPSSAAYAENIWCEVIAEGSHVNLIAIDVQLGVSDSLSVNDKSTCANIYTLPPKYTNNYRLEEVANLTNSFYVHYKGHGKFWIAFKTENSRISINCGILVDKGCNKRKRNNFSRINSSSRTKDHESAQEPWWIAVTVIAGLLVSTLTAFYFYKRHKSKQKIKVDKDLEQDDKGLYPDHIFSAIPAETNAIAPVSLSVPKDQNVVLSKTLVYKKGQ